MPLLRHSRYLESGIYLEGGGEACFPMAELENSKAGSPPTGVEIVLF